MHNKIVWVDIPVLKLDRAIRFYSAVMGCVVERTDYPGMSVGILPHKDGEAAGCLYMSEKVKPSADGPLVYLNAHGRLDVRPLRRWNRAAARFSRREEPIGPFGFRAVVLDSEGNRIALHSM